SSGELDRRHVRSPPGPVDGEEAQAGAGNAEQVTVGVGHQLVGLLGGGVEGQRVVDVVVHRIGHLLVGAVHRAGRGVQQVLHGMGAAAFQDVQEAVQVAACVGA